MDAYNVIFDRLNKSEAERIACLTHLLNNPRVNLSTAARLQIERRVGQHRPTQNPVVQTQIHVVPGQNNSEEFKSIVNNLGRLLKIYNMTEKYRDKTLQKLEDAATDGERVRLGKEINSITRILQIYKSNYDTFENCVKTRERSINNDEFTRLLREAYTSTTIRARVLSGFDKLYKTTRDQLKQETSKRYNMNWNMLPPPAN